MSSLVMVQVLSSPGTQRHRAVCGTVATPVGGSVAVLRGLTGGVCTPAVEAVGHARGHWRCRRRTTGSLLTFSVPPLSLMTVLTSVSLGWMSSLVMVQVLSSPGSNVTVPSAAQSPPQTKAHNRSAGSHWRCSCTLAIDRIGHAAVPRGAVDEQREVSSPSACHRCR